MKSYSYGNGYWLGKNMGVPLLFDKNGNIMDSSSYRYKSAVLMLSSSSQKGAVKKYAVGYDEEMYKEDLKRKEREMESVWFHPFTSPPSFFHLRDLLVEFRVIEKERHSSQTLLPSQLSFSNLLPHPRFTLRKYLRDPYLSSCSSTKEREVYDLVISSKSFEDFDRISKFFLKMEKAKEILSFKLIKESREIILLDVEEERKERSHFGLFLQKFSNFSPQLLLEPNFEEEKQKSSPKPTQPVPRGQEAWREIARHTPNQLLQMYKQKIEIIDNQNKKNFENRLNQSSLSFFNHSSFYQWYPVPSSSPSIYSLQITLEEEHSHLLSSFFSFLNQNYSSFSFQILPEEISILSNLLL